MYTYLCYRKFGSSGTIETHDTMCVLAVNIINEKIYIFLWFWLVCLTAITAAWLIYRIVVIVSSDVRFKLLQVRFVYVYVSVMSKGLTLTQQEFCIMLFVPLPLPMRGENINPSTRKKTPHRYNISAVGDISCVFFLCVAGVTCQVSSWRVLTMDDLNFGMA